MRAGLPEDFAAAGLGEQPTGAGTVVDLTVPFERVRRARKFRRRLLASDVLASEHPSLLFRGATPDAGVLVGLEGVLEAVDVHGALAAHLFGSIDLQQCVSGGADREEQVGVGVAADGIARQV